jgi:hypothetical protein
MFAQIVLNYLEVVHRIINILSLHLTHLSISNATLCNNIPLLFLLSALLEEDLPQHLLLLLVRVIILNIVIVWLVKHKVVVMVTVRVLIPYPPCLY